MILAVEFSFYFFCNTLVEAPFCNIVRDDYHPLIQTVKNQYETKI